MGPFQKYVRSNKPNIWPSLRHWTHFNKRVMTAVHFLWKPTLPSYLRTYFMDAPHSNKTKISTSNRSGPNKNLSKQIFCFTTADKTQRYIDTILFTKLIYKEILTIFNSNIFWCTLQNELNFDSSQYGITYLFIRPRISSQATMSDT